MKQFLKDNNYVGIANYLKIKERKIRVPSDVMFTDPQVMTVETDLS